MSAPKFFAGIQWPSAEETEERLHLGASSAQQALVNKPADSFDLPSLQPHLIGRWADQTLGLTPMRPAKGVPVREVPPITAQAWNRILRTWPSATAQKD